MLNYQDILGTQAFSHRVGPDQRIGRSDVSAFLLVLGGFTFFKFVLKALIVFSEIFLLPGTNVSST